MIGERLSRPQVLLGGIAVYLAPLGSPAFAALFEDRLLTPPQWDGRDLKYRIDGTAKVTGEKMFARDIRARDMPHWPQHQAHALVLRVAKADRVYAGFDLSVLDPDLQPDRVVTAADLERDGLAFPAFYGVDMLLPEGRVAAYLGQAVAILIYRDFARFRFAKYKVQFDDSVVRYGEVTGALERDPWGSTRFVRVGGDTPYDADLFSPFTQGIVIPAYRAHAAVWPAALATGDVGAEGMQYADGIDRELAQPPADWLVLTRDYASPSADVAALEPDNANGWYDAAKRELHLVVATQSPQEVAEGASAMVAQSRIAVERVFLHPCYTVGYGSKDHCPMPYYGVVAALYGDGLPVRLANDRFEQFQAGLKRHAFEMRYTMAVDRTTGLLQAFQAAIAANGGGRMNCSVLLARVGAAAAQSIYYFPKSDLATTALATRAVDAHPGKYYGVGFACIQRDFGTGAEASLAKVVLAPDGRIELSHTATEIGTGASSSQAVACARWLGRPADAVHLAITDWPDLPVETTGNPHTMSQADQDRLSHNPLWTPAFASASSASNSAFYFTHTTREAARTVFRHGLWPAALAIWGEGVGGGEAGSLPLQPEDSRWADGSLTADGMPPLPLVRLAQEAHARGLVVGAAVHAFNRWQWAEASFTVDGEAVRVPLDALSVRYGDGAAAEKRALMTTPGGFQVLQRQEVAFPATKRNDAMVTYYSAVGTLAELAVDAATGKVAVLAHHTVIECGDVLVPELVSGQIQGGTAMGIGHALLEQLPLHEDGPGDGTWNFNRYHLPRCSDVAVWTQTAEVLPPVSDTDPPKGMAEVTMIPIVAAIVSGITHAIGHRFRTLPVTPDMVLEVLA